MGEQQPRDALEVCLDAYQVGDADAALLERIMQQAMQIPQVSASPRYIMVWQRYGRMAMLGMSAVVGFVLGGLMPELSVTSSPLTTVASANSSVYTFQSLVVGANSLEEIRL